MCQSLEPADPNSFFKLRAHEQNLKADGTAGTKKLTCRRALAKSGTEALISQRPVRMVAASGCLDAASDDARAIVIETGSPAAKGVGFRLTQRVDSRSSEGLLLQVTSFIFLYFRQGFGAKAQKSRLAPGM